MLKMFLKMGQGLEKWGDDKSRQLKKSMSTALKREGFLLAATLRKDIKAGIDPKLSSMARRFGGKFPARKPFLKLRSTLGARGPSKGMIPIRYNPVMDGKKLGVEIGMVDTRQEKISKSWKRIFISQQEGFTQTITTRQRRYLARLGGEMPKRMRLRKHLFLKKSTKTFKTPGRSVIDPFWQKWERQSMQRLSDNFHKKMAGERI